MNEREIANFGIVSSCGCEPETYILAAHNSEHHKMTRAIHGQAMDVLALLASLIGFLAEDTPKEIILGAVFAGLSHKGDDDDVDC